MVPPSSVTVSYMETTLTIRLPDNLVKKLDEACAKSGRSKSDYVREKLATALRQDALERVFEVVGAAATAAGYHTEDQVIEMMNTERAKKREENKRKAETA
jgi:predicted transcriptional regulator